MFGTGGGEVSPSLYLFTDTQRYLFNCGENLQRTSIEHRVKLTKIKNIFVTRVSWRNLGGFPGLAMYMRMNMGRAHFYLHGPESLAGFVRASRLFLEKENVKIETPRECGDGGPLPIYKDENITVTTVELLTGSRSVDPPTSSGDSDSEPEPKRARHASSKLPSNSTSVAAFICKLVDVPGKFNPQSAIERGLPPGPAYKKLKLGESVTTPEGRVIQPEDVMGPPQIGPTFVVVECPHAGFIPSVTTHPKLQSDTFVQNGQPLALVVHIAPPEVLLSDDYSRWVSSFPPETKHLLLEKGVCPNEVSFRSVLKLQTPLHLMNPLVHQLPAALTEKQEQPSSALQMLSKESVIVGKVLMKYSLKPATKAGMDESDTLGTVRDSVEAELKEIQSNPTLANAVLYPENSSKPSAGQSMDSRQDVEMEEGGQPKVAQSSMTEPTVNAQIALSELVSRLYRPPQTKRLCPGDVMVTFTGTGSACPSKYRNVTGILVQVPHSGNLLFDCGEGTLSQIYQTFGQQGGDEIIKDLKAVFISHIHGDHHFGSASILQRKAELMASEFQRGRKQRGSSRTVVIGPPAYGQWLQEYNQACERVPHRFVQADSLLGGVDRSLLGSASEVLQNQLTDFSIETVPVVHCYKAFGVIVEHKTGWKIVYSGDTRPCPKLAEAGRNASLLIHEATFEDDLQTDAETKKHCTISEALEIARQMNPEFTILTHFSQRYPKVSPALVNGEHLQGKVGVAFDGMSVRLSDVHSLPAFLPAMREVFSALTDTEDSSVTWNWL